MCESGGTKFLEVWVIQNTKLDLECQGSKSFLDEKKGKREARALVKEAFKIHQVAAKRLKDMLARSTAGEGDRYVVLP